MDLLSNTRTESNLPAGNLVLDENNTEILAESFRALVDPHRLRILYLLLTCGEMCVCECITALELTQSNLSFHLKTLRQAGFIKARKSGKWMYYSLNRPAFERFRSLFDCVFDLTRWPDRPQCTTCDDA